MKNETKSGAPPIRAFVSKSKTRQKVVRAGSSEDKEKVRFCPEMKNETKRAASPIRAFVSKTKTRQKVLRQGVRQNFEMP